MPLVRPVVWGGVAVLAAFSLWWAPVSPMALSRGDVMVGRGEVEAAVDYFDRVANYNPWNDVRVAARVRAANLMRLNLRDALGARLRLRAIADDPHSDIVVRAQAWEQIGDLLRLNFNDPDGAAGAYRVAYDTAPKHIRACGRLEASARALEETGDLDEAHHAWDRVARKFPSRRAVARVNQASLLLGRGRLRQALDLYEDALDHDPSPDLAEVASRGATIAKDRLETINSVMSEERILQQMRAEK